MSPDLRSGATRPPVTPPERPPARDDSQRPARRAWVLVETLLLLGVLLALAGFIYKLLGALCCSI